VDEGSWEKKEGGDGEEGRWERGVRQMNGKDLTGNNFPKHIMFFFFFLSFLRICKICIFINLKKKLFVLSYICF
jgi:hypothetical protein